MFRSASADSVQLDIQRALGPSKVVRSIPLWHVNGLEAADRQVEVFPLLVQETDTGAFAPEAMEASKSGDNAKKNKKFREMFGQVLRTKWVGAQLKFLAPGGPNID